MADSGTTRQTDLEWFALQTVEFQDALTKSAEQMAALSLSTTDWALDCLLATVRAYVEAASDD